MTPRKGQKPKNFRQIEKYIFKNGHPSYLTIESIQKTKRTMKGKIPKNLELLHKLRRERRWPIRVGEKCNLWKGGISFETYSVDWTNDLKEIIRKRDNYICQLCGKTQGEEIEKMGRKLSVHHIDYNKKNCNHDNLITLCDNCNLKINFRRLEWRFLFCDKASKNKIKNSFPYLFGNWRPTETT